MNRTLIGWREWLRLPDLGVEAIKAKVDTGARTSALHVEELRWLPGHRRVSFTIYPMQRSRKGAVRARADLVGERTVRSSNGMQELRPVIHTPLVLGEQTWMIELTLTSRDVMGFRMLLGRQATRGRVLIDPGRSFVTRRLKRRKKRPAAGS